MNLANPDIKIALSASQLQKIDLWLETFFARNPRLLCRPTVENNHLAMNSSDNYALLEAVWATEYKETDFLEMKTALIVTLKELLEWKRSPLVEKYYQGLVEALENI